MTFLIIFFHYLFRFIHIVPQELYLSVFCQHFRCTEVHAGHIYIDGTFHTASAGFLHSLPVLERITDQQVRRNGSDRVIEVTYFYGIQCHFYHCTVCTVFRHRDPISHFQHIVGRKLDAGDESHDTVFENQHQNGSGSPQSGQQHHWTLLYQDTDNNNGPYKEENDLCCLQKSFQWFILILFACAIYEIKGRKQSTNETKKDC